MSDRRSGSGGWVVRGPELAGGLLLVLGLVLFLGNANILHISWNLIWPLLVVALGAVILVSALRPRADLPTSVSIPRDGAEQLELDLTLGAGSFRVRGGATALVEVQSTRGDVVSRVDPQGHRTHVRLSQDGRWFPGVTGRSDWAITAAGDVPTALTVAGGAGNFDLDLSGMNVVDARMSVGAADARITLPTPVGEVAIRVSSGAASVTIQVPAGVEARVVGSGGLLSIQGRTETPGYGTARDRVTVTVSGGASSIKVV